MSKKHIAIDFDGVINSYRSGWHEHRIPDPPNPGAFEFIVRCQRAGYEVVIFSTRASSANGVRLIREWLALHNAPSSVCEVFITHQKPAAMVYIDDRGYRFSGIWPTMPVLDWLGKNPGMRPPTFVGTIRPDASLSNPPSFVPRDDLPDVPSLAPPPLEVEAEEEPTLPPPSLTRPAIPPPDARPAKRSRHRRD